MWISLYLLQHITVITKMNLWLFSPYFRVAILLTVSFALLTIFQVYSSQFQQFQPIEDPHYLYFKNNDLYGDSFEEDSQEAGFDIRSPGSQYNQTDVYPHSNLIPDTPQRIIYNRVPKSGSTTTRSLIKNLSDIRNFPYYSSKVYRTYLLGGQKQTEEFTDFLYKLSTPLVYERHLNYVDFSEFGREPPLYINLVRDPTKTFVSRYYFDRFKSGNKHLFKSTQHMTLHSCLHNEHEQCNGTGLVLMSNFFCGQEEICKTEAPEALQLAKANIDKYLVVGVLDRYADFLHVLECLLPRYFTGVKKMYRNFSHKSKKKNQTHKKPQTDADMALLTKRLHKQHDIYHYIEQKFDELYKKVIQICPA